MHALKFKIFILFTLLLSLNVNSQDDEDERISDDQVFIKLKYSACLRGNNCPRYEINILGNGSMIYEGMSGVKRIGSHQKQIDKKYVAGLLTILLRSQFFEREDTSTSCYASVEVTGGGAYEKADSICILSSHGPITYIEAKFGDKHRKVRLENVFSEDYLKIKQMIIEAADVKRWVKKKWFIK